MNLIRQYLKQKAARLFNGRKLDMETAKKELREELTHLLYDQTRRTPIIIPVINEIGGATPPSGRPGNDNSRARTPKAPFVARPNDLPQSHDDAHPEAPHLAGRSPRDI